MAHVGRSTGFVTNYDKNWRVRQINSFPQLDIDMNCVFACICWIGEPPT
jgi:hypothetical protein